jgi:lycopene beta-cyclase
MLGTCVNNPPVKIASRWEISTPEKTYYAKYVVDTRPTPFLKEYPQGLFQSFSGIEVECENEVFDPETMDLMDFEENEQYEIFFTYVIPFSKKKALIEVTVFAIKPLEKNNFEKSLKKAVEKRVKGSEYKILRQEFGVLPMGISSKAPHQDPSYVFAGIQAGAARPSSGYAFRRIQNWASQCARGIQKKNYPIRHPQDTWLIRQMDRIFIAVLRSKPSIAPQLFLSLFKNVSSERVVRFLSGNATLSDCMQIIWALPAAPFLSEVPRAVISHHESN